MWVITINKELFWLETVGLHLSKLGTLAKALGQRSTLSLKNEEETSVAEASSSTTNKHPLNTCYSTCKTKFNEEILTVSDCYVDNYWNKIIRFISDLFQISLDICI